MKKVVIVLIVILIVLGLGIGSYFIYQNYFKSKEASFSPPASKALTLDADKIATRLSKVGGAENAYWMRSFDIPWEIIEPNEGDINFSEIDEMYQKFQKDDVYLVVTIKPFANWDQDKCHDTDYEADFAGPEKKLNQKLKVGKPC